jgi:hypothetical protein
MSSVPNRSTESEKFAQCHVKSYSGSHGSGFSERAILRRLPIGTKKNSKSHSTPGESSP